jgi:HSP20 family protein
VERSLRQAPANVRARRPLDDPTGGEKTMLYLTRNRAGDAGLRPFNGIDRLFDEMTRGFAPAATLGEAEFAPSLDVTETATHWRVKAELPGVAIEDVEVSVTGNLLTIRGEKKGEAVVEGEGARRTERRYGKFERSLEFPSDVDAARVEAHAKNGVLTVTLPKAEEARRKTIAVKVE